MADIPLDSFAQELYDLHAPLQYDEANQDYALKKFFAAIGVMFQEVEDLARDDIVSSPVLSSKPGLSKPKVHPGWSILLDVDRIPDKGLGYLGQFVGVGLDPQLSSTKQRERIRRVEGWHKGQPNSIIQAAYQYLENYSTYRKHVMIDNPLGYWRLGLRTPGGTTLNDSAYANGLDFTLSGGFQGNADALINDPNNHSRATFFDGTFAGSRTSTSVLNFDGTKSFTFEVWISTASTSPVGTPAGIIQRGSTSGGQQGWLFGFVNVLGDDRIRVARFLNGASTSVESSLATVGLNTPVHVVATYDGTNLRLYMNGNLVAGPTASSTSIAAEALQSTFIGSNGSGVNFLNSTIDELAVYGYAMDAKRIADHHSAGRGTMVDPPTEGLVYLRERYLGNVADVDIVTSRLETDDSFDLLVALNTVKPAGLTFTHTIAPFRTFLQARNLYADFTALRSANATFQVLRDTISL